MGGIEGKYMGNRREDFVNKAYKSLSLKNWDAEYCKRSQQIKANEKYKQAVQEHREKRKEAKRRKRESDIQEGTIGKLNTTVNTTWAKPTETNAETHTDRKTKTKTERDGRGGKDERRRRQSR